MFDIQEIIWKVTLMKILSWNCNCRFRDKYHLLDKYNADILIIQECENPQHSSNSEYKL